MSREECLAYIIFLKSFTAQSGSSDKAKIRLVGQATAATRMPRALWNAMQSMPAQNFASSAFPSNYLLRKALKDEAQLDVRYVDCCVNGCRAFTRSYSKDTICHSCQQPRYHANVRTVCLSRRHDKTLLRSAQVLIACVHSRFLQGKAQQKFESTAFERSSRIGSPENVFNIRKWEG